MPHTIVDQAAALIAMHLYRLLKTLLNNLDMLWRIGQLLPQLMQYPKQWAVCGSEAVSRMTS